MAERPGAHRAVEAGAKVELGEGLVAGGAKGTLRVPMELKGQQTGFEGFQPKAKAYELLFDPAKKEDLAQASSEEWFVRADPQEILNEFKAEHIDGLINTVRNMAMRMLGMHDYEAQLEGAKGALRSAESEGYGGHGAAGELEAGAPRAGITAADGVLSRVKLLREGDELRFLQSNPERATSILTRPEYAEARNLIAERLKLKDKTEDEIWKEFKGLDVDLVKNLLLARAHAKLADVTDGVFSSQETTLREVVQPYMEATRALKEAQEELKTLQQQIGVAAYVQPDASRPEDEYHTVTSRWLGNQGRVPKGHVRKQLKKQIGVLRDELQKLQDNTDLSVRRSLARKQSDAAKHLKTQMAELNGLLGSKRSTNLYLMKSLGLEPLKDYGGYGVFGW